MEFIDVGLTPCINTALPNKVFESLFFGNPIVFSMTGEAKTLLEKHKAGTYYQKGDINSLISALKALTRHTTLQEMKKNARILYDTHLRSEKINTAFCEFIEKSAIKY